MEWREPVMLKYFVHKNFKIYYNSQCISPKFLIKMKVYATEKLND